MGKSAGKTEVEGVPVEVAMAAKSRQFTRHLHEG